MTDPTPQPEISPPPTPAPQPEIDPASTPDEVPAQPDDEGEGFERPGAA